jgi:hypothetical protein
VFGLSLSDYAQTPRPENLEPGFEDSADVKFGGDYNTLAGKLGVHSRVALAPPTLGRILREEGISVYRLAEVEKYLDKKGQWSWYPLRQCDRVNDKHGNVWAIRRETNTRKSGRYGDVVDRLYYQPVPFPVLCTVELLASKLSKDAIFMVAAPNNDPDPFLGVWLHETSTRHMTVIERWDEPSFRGIYT